MKLNDQLCQGGGGWGGEDYEQETQRLGAQPWAVLSSLAQETRQRVVQILHSLESSGGITTINTDKIQALQHKGTPLCLFIC